METAASDEKAVSPPPSGKWRAAACLVAVLPAIGALLGVRTVYHTIRAMAQIGSVGVGAVSMGLSEGLPSVVTALVAGAVIAGFLAIALGTRPARVTAFPGFLFSLLVTVLGCVPALFLWAVESFTFDIVANRVTGSISDASQHLTTLLIGTVVSAIAAACIALAASTIPAIWRGHDARVGPRVAVWAGTAILLLGLAALFYVRFSYLHGVALRGHL